MLVALAGAPMAAEQPAHGTATPTSQASAPAAEPELREEPRIGETPGGHGTAQEHGADAPIMVPRASMAAACRSSTPPPSPARSSGWSIAFVALY